MQKTWRGVSAGLGCGAMVLVAIVTGGCTLSPKPMTISHRQLKPVIQQRQGDLLVRPLIDKRAQTQYVGRMVYTKMGGTAYYFETTKGDRLDVLLTQYFVEALQNAGYSAVLDTSTPGSPLSEAKYDAIISGEIVEFWMDNYLHYPSTVFRVAVRVQANSPDAQKVLWEKLIEGTDRHIDGSWESLTEPFVRHGVTDVLNRFAWEFASDDFYARVIRKQP